VRLMELAERFSLPVISFVDTAGAFPGRIATADRVMMLEHSIYSVISPEGCASILWRDGAKAKDAAKAMKITAQDLKRLGVIDTIIKEPVGGAHRTPDAAMKTVGTAIHKALDELSGLSAEELIKHRRAKFLNIG